MTSKRKIEQEALRSFKDYEEVTGLMKSIIKMSELGDEEVTPDHAKFTDMPGQAAKAVVEKIKWTGLPCGITECAALLLGLLARDKTSMAEMYLALCLEKEKELITVDTFKTFMKDKPSLLDLFELFEVGAKDDRGKEINVLDNQEFWQYVYEGNTCQEASGKVLTNMLS